MLFAVYYNAFCSVLHCILQALTGGMGPCVGDPGPKCGTRRPPRRRRRRHYRSQILASSPHHPPSCPRALGSFIYPIDLAIRARSFGKKHLWSVLSWIFAVY